MNYETPCAEGNPEDWFIGRDGKQYPGDDIVSREHVEAHLAEIDPTHELGVDDRDKAVDRLEASVKRGALRRRRHARDKCYTECYFRTSCLDLALKNDHQHGTWGGYYEEEIREIRKEISRRKRARNPQE